jgi:hypothetical protein
VNMANQLRCLDGPIRFTFTNDKQDGIGFADLDPDGKTPTPGGVADDIRNECKADGAPLFQVGSQYLQNGNDLNKQILEAMQGIGAKKGGGDGDCVIGSVQDFAVMDDGCDGGDPKFNMNPQVVGFVRARLVEVTDNKGGVVTCPGAAPAPALDPTNNKPSLVLQFLCEPAGQPDGTGGGRIYNASAPALRLVQ